MSFLILDEWIWADLLGENGVVKQKESFRFIVAVYEKCDQLFTAEQSKFMVKAFGFLKCGDIPRRKIAKILSRNFIFNDRKLKGFKESELSFLQENILKSVNVDDHYLLQVYFTKPDSTIITTDGRLISKLIEYSISYEHRDTFIPSYISKYAK